MKKDTEKKAIFRATKDCLYSDGANKLRFFKVGEKLPDSWKTGCEGFKHFAPDDGLMSWQRKMNTRAAKYA